MAKVIASITVNIMHDKRSVGTRTSVPEALMFQNEAQSGIPRLDTLLVLNVGYDVSAIVIHMVRRHECATDLHRRTKSMIFSVGFERSTDLWAA